MSAVDSTHICRASGPRAFDPVKGFAWRLRRVFHGVAMAIVLSGQLIPLPSMGLPPSYVAVHQNEAALLHRRIDPELFAKLLVWDGHLATWRPSRPGELPGASPGRTPAVLVLHLWADWCVPCREEFPIVRDFAGELGKRFPGQLGFVWLSETASPSAMQAFLEQNGARMPQGPHLLDTGEGIADKLRENLLTPWALPVTLLVDQELVVRHAIVGKLASRRDELREAVGRLLALKHTPRTDVSPRRSSRGQLPNSMP